MLCIWHMHIPENFQLEVFSYQCLKACLDLYDEISHLSSHKNTEINQSVFGSYLWVSFPQTQSAGSYFAVFLFADFSLYLT